MTLTPSPYKYCIIYQSHHSYEHDNDSLFYRAGESDSLIAVLWHFSRVAN